MTITIEIDLPDLEMATVNRKKTARKLANWSANQTRRRLRRGRYRDGGKIPVAKTSTTGRPLIDTNQMIKKVKASLVRKREQVQYIVKPRGYRLTRSESRKASAEKAARKKGGGASRGGKKRVGRRTASGKERKAHELVWHSLQKHHMKGGVAAGITNRQVDALGRMMVKEIGRQLDSGEFFKKKKRRKFKLRGRAGRVISMGRRVGRML